MVLVLELRKWMSILGQEATSSQRKEGLQMVGDLMCLRIRETYCKELDISLGTFVRK